MSTNKFKGKPTPKPDVANTSSEALEAFIGGAPSVAVAGETSEQTSVEQVSVPKKVTAPADPEKKLVRDSIQVRREQKRQVTEAAFNLSSSTGRRVSESEIYRMALDEFFAKDKKE